MNLVFKKTMRFGLEYIYPACEKSEALAKLVRKKTFSTEDIAMILEIGFKIKWAQS